MSYALPSDMAARYPNRDLVQLTNENPTVQTVNNTFLQTFLNDASFKIDSYLESRFQLPLQSIPQVLTMYCCTIAMYYLQNLRPIHDLEYAKLRYEDTIKQLEEVRDGTLTLGLSANLTEPDAVQNPAVVEVHAGGGVSPGVGWPGSLVDGQAAGIVPMRVFSRGHLVGF